MKFNNNKFILGVDFIYNNKRILLTPKGKEKIKKVKKLTGSRFGAVFGEDSFKSPFQLWCELLGMYTDEPNRFFLDAGTIIEPKLKQYAEEKMNKKFQSYDPKNINYDLFSHNQVFGGIPDGEEIDSLGQVSSILEIKTAQMDKYKWTFKDNQYTLNMQAGKPLVKIEGGGLVKWFKNGEVIIPKNYKYQLSLYLYLRNITKGYFCVAFLKNKDYENPDSVNFVSEFNNYKEFFDSKKNSLNDKDRLLIWKEHTVDLEEFQKNIDYAKNWYETYVLKGESPEMTTEDLTWFRYGYPDLM